MPFRLKRPKSLATKVRLCPRFGKRQSVYGKPPLGIRNGARLTLRAFIVSGSAKVRD